MTKIHFSKMHGLGNDFVVINAMQQPLTFTAAKVTSLAHRHTGIGFDQLLVIEATTQAADFFCRIYNADGSEAEQCGNGLRCVARFIHQEKLHADSTFHIATVAGVYTAEIKEDDQVCIAMGAPQLQTAMMTLTVKDQAIPMSVLSVGNPHAIIKVETLNTINLALAAAISTHSFFPKGTNVGYMEIVNPHHIRLRTFERGAGETHACGSNACAAVCVGIINDWLQSEVTVEFRYGCLHVKWQGDHHPVYMTGPAVRVFDGILNNKRE